MSQEPPKTMEGNRSARQRRWRVAACFVLMLAAWYGLAGPRVALSQWMVTADNNASMTEAMAWLDGRLDLPHEGRDTRIDRMHDTAWDAKTGRVYNVVPPLMTLVCFVAMAIESAWLGQASGVLGPFVFATIVVGPLLLVGYWAFRTQVRDPRWAAFLTLAWLVGTAVYPMMARSQGGNVGYVNHLLSQVGILLIAADVMGRRRIWPAAIGLILAVWSRQMTLFYTAPMLWIAWTGPRRRHDLTIATTAVVLAIGGLMLLNQLKFGSPFESGYRLIYAGRNDPLALRARQGLFALQWIPDNLRYMVWRLPRVALSHQGLALSGHAEGNSLVFSTPLVLLVFATAPTWWHDRRRRAMMLATAPVILGILMYHAPGFHSNGCYRFGLDYLPVWLMVAAPALVFDRWRGWTMACAAWSVVYFQMLDAVQI